MLCIVPLGPSSSCELNRFLDLEGRLVCWRLDGSFGMNLMFSFVVGLVGKVDVIVVVEAVVGAVVVVVVVRSNVDNS